MAKSHGAFLYARLEKHVFRSAHVESGIAVITQLGKLGVNKAKQLPTAIYCSAKLLAHVHQLL
jgi:hypothetical protein